MDYPSPEAQLAGKAIDAIIQDGIEYRAVWQYLKGWLLEQYGYVVFKHPDTGEWLTQTHNGFNGPKFDNFPAMWRFVTTQQVDSEVLKLPTRQDILDEYYAEQDTIEDILSERSDK